MDWTNPDSLRQALKAYRERHKLTRDEFAAENNLSRWWVEKFEQEAIKEPKTGRAKELGAILSKPRKAA